MLTSYTTKSFIAVKDRRGGRRSRCRTSREIPHEFRYHAKVLNDHLADVLRSGMFDDIDHFSRCLYWVWPRRTDRA
jgi:hypothetical protein